jgi:hypothetical protein
MSCRLASCRHHDLPIAGFPPQLRVVLRALKEYGMVVADNGSDWYLSGTPHPRWSNEQLHKLHDVPVLLFGPFAERSETVPSAQAPLA